MRSNGMHVLVTGVAALLVGVYAETSLSGQKNPPANDPAAIAIDKGVKWLVSVQGQDGGWGQDGGETSYVRQGEHLESNGNDVANSAVAAEALLHTGNTPFSGPYRQNLQRAVRFILERVERSPADGLAVTDLAGTQIQRKLGPYIDTFLTSKLLAELDGNMGDVQANARVRQDLRKCVAKIEKNQLKDGSWNIAGGWAPILGTSLASQSLFMAQSKGVAVNQLAMSRVEDYTQKSGAGSVPSGAVSVSAAAPSALSGGATMTESVMVTDAASAGVPLYKRAQELEQLSRTDKDRKDNAPQIAAIMSQLANPQVATGYGSIGGEEFFSWLNIGDSLHRTGGPEWRKWNSDMTAKILKLQNEDGTWSGHHCITGRVAVTSAAILLLRADREPAVVLTSNVKGK